MCGGHKVARIIKKREMQWPGVAAVRTNGVSTILQRRSKNKRGSCGRVEFIIHPANELASVARRGFMFERVGNFRRRHRLKKYKQPDVPRFLKSTSKSTSGGGRVVVQKAKMKGVSRKMTRIVKVRYSRWQ